MTRSWAVALAVGLQLSAAGCGHTASAPAPMPAPPARPAVVPVPEPPPSAAIGDAMADHFLIATWSRDVVIAGVLDPLREPLEALANYRYDDVRPGGWVQPITELQTAARLTARAESLDVAAMGVATMTRICGECHRASGVEPAVRAHPMRIEGGTDEGLPARMALHMQGAALLWQGLARPSEEAWAAGARALSQAPAELDEALPADFDADLREVRALGIHASAAETMAQRADAYGLLLATCAGCHDRWIEHGP